MHVTVLAGGVGGAKMAHGFALLASEPARDLRLSVVVNTADDLELHGLHVSPDLDTVMYTLAGLANPETGWGLRDETWSNLAMLERYGAPTWFRLGDRDLATHLLRTASLRQGGRLTDVTWRLAGSLGVAAQLLPMTDAAVRTRVRTIAGWLEFQDYFVRRRQTDAVLEVRFDGIESATPTPEVLDAVGSADLLVLAPPNPVVSIGPILALGGVEQAIWAARAPVVAVSPIVGGRALKGPADRMLTSLGGEASAGGVARHYAERHPGLLDVLVIDRVDTGAAAGIERLGIRAVVSETVMREDADRARLAAAMCAMSG